MRPFEQNTTRESNKICVFFFQSFLIQYNHTLCFIVCIAQSHTGRLAHMRRYEAKMCVHEMVCGAVALKMGRGDIFNQRSGQKGINGEVSSDHTM